MVAAPPGQILCICVLYEDEVNTHIAWLYELLKNTQERKSNPWLEFVVMQHIPLKNK